MSSSIEKKVGVVDRSLQPAEPLEISTNIKFVSSSGYSESEYVKSFIPPLSSRFQFFDDSLKQDFTRDLSTVLKSYGLHPQRSEAFTLRLKESLVNELNRQDGPLTREEAHLIAVKVVRLATFSFLVDSFVAQGISSRGKATELLYVADVISRNPSLYAELHERGNFPFAQCQDRVSEFFVVKAHSEPVAVPSVPQPEVERPVRNNPDGSEAIFTAQILRSAQALSPSEVRALQLSLVKGEEARLMEEEGLTRGAAFSRALAQLGHKGIDGCYGPYTHRLLRQTLRHAFHRNFLTGMETPQEVLAFLCTKSERPSDPEPTS